MTPKELAEIQMCDECISHLMENAGPDHIIVKYRTALIKLQEQAEEIIRANHRYADLQNICDDQDKEIKRLEDALDKKRNREADLLILVGKQYAALKKLGGMVRARGKALVEERAKQVEIPGDRPDLTHEGEARLMARQQLRAEGVIR